MRLTTIFKYIIDTVVPPDPTIEMIERIGRDGFREKAGPAPFGAGHTIPSSDIIWLYHYKNPLVKAALVEIKDRPNKKIASILGALLFEKLYALHPNGQKILILPIPITRAKKRKRGWNQCELILKGFRECDHTNFFETHTDILKKISETEDQVGKSKQSRFKNIRGTFAVKKPHMVKGRDVIVFDDILTTGATLTEARNILNRCGARSVTCVAIAH